MYVVIEVSDNDGGSPHTGMSSVKMAISEIGVSFPDDTFGEESRYGVPFTVSNCGYNI